jgi:Protein of unknown function (DUF3048) N-terminal domain/Protein of unknown function (DUF3048) C-terminal domain
MSVPWGTTGRLRQVVSRHPRLTAATALAVAAVAAVSVTLALRPASDPVPPRPAAAILAPPPSATPRPTPSPPKGPLLDPFTGEPAKALKPVLAVKIDNIVLARPQTGLTHADIVYVLPVEGGLSRFLAVFSSHFPPVIGPVRSAREDDIELLRQFGRPAFAFSGAQPQLLPVVEHSRIVDLYAGLVGGYYRDLSRIEPYNLFAQTKTLLAEARRAGRARRAGQAHGPSTAHDIGFRFGPAPAGGHARASFSVGYSAASFEFRWSARRARWLVWMDGSPALTTDAGQLRPATVVIQYTRVRTSRFLEQGRVRPPFAVSTGSGTAVVLRGGMAYQVHWSRPRRPGGTTFRLPSGRPMTFARGQVWVVLVARK